MQYAITTTAILLGGMVYLQYLYYKHCKTDSTK